MMGPALSVKDYSYLNRRKRDDSETCLNFAMIGSVKYMSKLVKIA